MGKAALINLSTPMPEDQQHSKPRQSEFERLRDIGKKKPPRMGGFGMDRIKRMYALNSVVGCMFVCFLVWYWPPIQRSREEWMFTMSKEEAQKTNQYMIRDGVKGVGIDANGNKVFWNCSEDDLASKAVRGSPQSVFYTL